MISPIVLVGIAAGGAVFVGTLVVVYFLLQQGGSFDRMRQEAVGLPAAVGETKPLLYDELLSLAQRLSTKPPPLEQELVGGMVRIRNLKQKEDAAALFKISDGTNRGGIYGETTYDANDLIWKYMEHGPFEKAADFEAALNALENKPDSRQYVVLDAETKQPIGALMLRNNSPRDLRVEIGAVWFTPAFQSTGACPETVLLVLKHLFEIGYRRVEWRCDGHNVRARRAAHSMGFTFEGVLRKHMIVKNSNRDTVVFAAINSEWPAMREHLEGKVHKAMVQAGKTPPLSTETAAKDKKTR